MKFGIVNKSIIFRMCPWHKICQSPYFPTKPMQKTKQSLPCLRARIHQYCVSGDASKFTKIFNTKSIKKDYMNFYIKLSGTTFGLVSCILKYW